MSLSSSTPPKETRKSRHELKKRTSSVYFGEISKALFPIKQPPAFRQLIRALSGTKFVSQHHGSAVWPTHDLWANELLLWILPTHMLTHLIKFGVVLLTLLFAVFVCTLELQLQDEMTMTTYLMVTMLWTVLVLAIPSWIYWYYQLTLYGIMGDKPWMDPKIPEINRMDMHVPLRLYESPSNARRGACLPQLVSRKDYNMITPNVLLLDDLDWKFQLHTTVEDALNAVYQDRVEEDTKQQQQVASTAAQNNATESNWDPISIPGNWMLQGFNDIPIYTNQKYPFPCRPPIVPRENPTGVYKLEMTLPEDWMDDNHDDQALTILLHGVESACFVFCNGELLGFFKDSRLPSEFQLPNYCTLEQELVFHIVVARWSDGSYMEDQDHWWMAGIHRSVELIRRKRGADIMNYHVSAAVSGDLSVQVQMRATVEDSSPSSTRVLNAQLYTDKQLTPDGTEWKAERQVWSQTLELEERLSSPSLPSSPKEVNFVVHIEGQIEEVKTWTAETPNLYTLVLELQDTEGNITQVESCRVGFRTVDVDNGILHVNGKRITVCGINRHEHDPDHGKVVSLERMHQDITVLKQNNFNAIRTSHYPTHSSFYRLCDFYGMYVCDEANIETHGMKPMGRLAHDWGWEAAFVSRVRRMVLRDWNHPCIITWSLGNEAGRGRNLVKARNELLKLDTTRPVCYESGGSWPEGTGRTELTDIICPMYPNVTRTIRLAERADEDRPVILCEYSHSMNNSDGNLHLYWEQIWDPALPRLQGGYIWDMIDQGLRKKTVDGREFFAYGGDFGDSVNDRQFCINGMFSPDRELHPAVHEIKFLQQPVDVTLPDGQEHIELKVSKTTTPVLAMLEPDMISKPTLEIENRYSFSNLNHISWRWKLHSNSGCRRLGEGIARFDGSLLEVDLQQSVKRLRELESEFGNSNLCFFLNIEGVLNSDHSWASEGHVVVRKQFPLRIRLEGSAKQESSLPSHDLLPSLQIASDESFIKVSSGNETPFLSIDKSTGGIVSMKRNGDNEMLVGPGIQSNFTRAATDNDKGGMELVLDFMLLSWAKPLFLLIEDSTFSYEMHWKRFGISQETPPKIICTEVSISEETNGDVAEIETHSDVQTKQGKTILKQVFQYKIFKNGSFRLSHRVTPTATIKRIPSLPRIGISLLLDPSLYTITYYGRGPHENYPDRKSGSFTGIWQTSPSEMGYNYIVPSENGNRSDCEWVVFDSLGQGGLVVVDDSRSKFHFSALLHTANELHHAEHTCDLDTRETGRAPISVSVDTKMMGVGGDVSWFPCVYPDFRVAAEEHSYRIPFEWQQTQL